MSVRTGFSRSWPAKAGPTLLAAILLIAGFLSLAGLTSIRESLRSRE